MKQTKEQMIIELTKLRTSHAEWVDGDECRRREFAKAFGWKKDTKRNGYGYSEQEIEWQVPTWEQIFVKLGKLLSTDKFVEISNQIKFQDSIILNMDERLKNLDLLPAPSERG